MLELARERLTSISLLSALALLACGGSSDQGDTHASKPPAAAAGVVQHPDPSLPMSKRIQGLWRMDLAKVPDTALTEQFRKLKKQGKAKQLRIEYRVTDTEFVLTSFGPNGPVSNRFTYEILNEGPHAMVLKKSDDTGKTQEIGVALKDDQLIIGTGNGEVPLQRVAMPEGVR